MYAHMMYPMDSKRTGAEILASGIHCELVRLLCVVWLVWVLMELVIEIVAVLMEKRRRKKFGGQRGFLVHAGNGARADDRDERQSIVIANRRSHSKIAAG